MQRRVRPMIGVTALSAIVCGVLGAGGCQRQAPAPPPPPTPEVVAATIQPQQVVLTTELPGRTSPYLVAEIRPQVNGLIQKRLFTEGADVKAGDVLYQIDPAPFQAALDTAEAALGRSQATLPSIQCAGRTLQGSAGRQSGQPAGLRRRDQCPESGPGRHSVLESVGGDGPHQPARTPGLPRRFPGGSAGPP